MGEELAYAMVTSHSIAKSRTGNLLSRLISRTGLELVSGSVFSPSRELAERYADLLQEGDNGNAPPTGRLIADYLREKFIAVDEGAPRRRVLMLVFRGENAVERMKEVVGEVGVQRCSGETIRDTYGEYITDDRGKVVFFEPAVLIGDSCEEVQAHLELWALFSDADGGICDGAAPRDSGDGDSSRVEKTLVLIKPDNFKFPNIRPGALIDVFSRTGLFIVGFKVQQMSVAQAEEFYGPVLPVLEEHFRESHGPTVVEMVEERFGLGFSDEDGRAIADVIGPIMGRRYWENLIQFMAGNRPSEVADTVARDAPGTQKTIALVYEGVGAVRKIREVLGPTDPSKAPAGTIRREFGTTVMINAAHASDSVENARREMDLIGIGENHFARCVAEFYGARRAGPETGFTKKTRNLFH